MNLRTLSHSETLQLPKKGCQVGFCNRRAPFSNVRIGLMTGFSMVVCGSCRQCNLLACSKCAFEDRSAVSHGSGVSMLRCPYCGRLLGRSTGIDLFLSSQPADTDEYAASFSGSRITPAELRELHHYAFRFGVLSHSAFRKTTSARDRKQYLKSALLLLEETHRLGEQSRVGLAWCMARLGVVLWEGHLPDPARQAFESALNLAVAEGDNYLAGYLLILATATPQTQSSENETQHRADIIESDALSLLENIERPASRNEAEELLGVLFAIMRKRPATRSTFLIESSILPHAARRGIVLANLSLLQRSAGYLADAFVLQQKAFAIWKTQLGASSIALCQCLVEYSNALFKNGSPRTACLLDSHARRILFRLIWAGPPLTTSNPFRC